MNPIDEALYVKNIYDVDKEIADKLRFKAIKYSFDHHYRNSVFYNRYCKSNNIMPDDIKNIGDLAKIPLIPSSFFKRYPERPREFVRWLKSICSCSVPDIRIDGNEDLYTIFKRFDEKGMRILTSSGTSGQEKAISLKDQATYERDTHIWKSMFSEIGCSSDFDFVFLVPKTEYSFVGLNYISYNLLPSIFNNMVYATEKPLFDGAKAFKKHREKSFEPIAKLGVEKLVGLERDNRKICLATASAVTTPIMNYMKKNDIRFNFEDSVAWVAGSGLRTPDGQIIDKIKYMRSIEAFFGIKQENSREAYGMTEANAWLVDCEKHYLHIPHSFLQAFALDDELKPILCGSGEGEEECEGRYAFLDPTMTSCPGFIVTEDEIKLLNRCPECSKDCPVIKPPISRAPGAEIRGCAIALGRAMK